jgi:hypothetical protein
MVSSFISVLGEPTKVVNLEPDSARKSVGMSFLGGGLKVDTTTPPEP